MDTSKLRRESIAAVRDLGYEPNVALPLLDDDTRLLRSQEEVSDRALCVFTVVAAAYGFDRARALAWLHDEKLAQSLTPTESSYLLNGGNTETIRARVEALYALLWLLGHTEKINFADVCPPTLVHLLPNLKISESASEFRRKGHLVSDQEMVAQLDLVYCLHWAVVDAQLARRFARLPVHVIAERRRALEWVASAYDFDEVPLDT